jgi:hypothetical protein
MEFQDLVIQDAPCRERLVILGPVGPNSVRVKSAPKLCSAHCVAKAPNFLSVP